MILLYVFNKCERARSRNKLPPLRLTNLLEHGIRLTLAGSGRFFKYRTLTLEIAEEVHHTSVDLDRSS